MNSFNDTEPRLVSTGQGSNILYTVNYRNKFLYSKYNPEKTINILIENTVILPGTLIIASSPVLRYGINKLKEKLPRDCTILFCEFNADLYNFTLKNNDLFCTAGNLSNEKEILYSENDLEKIDCKTRNLVKTGKIKRVIKIDFSQGVSFSEEKYNFLLNGLTDIISTFWKNRITLQKMGKLYTTNIFKNLCASENFQEISGIKNTVSKPIIVCGAGESLKEIYAVQKSALKNFYIIAVDAALKPLLDDKINVDAAVAMESQAAIEQAYLGVKLDNITGFVDLCSRPSVAKKFNNKVWFTSEFCDCSFLSELKNSKVISGTIKPLGSVGLAAVYIALLLRKNDSVPVYIAGLDFSYSKDFTHIRGSFPVTAKILKTNRLNLFPDFNSCFGRNAISLTAQSGKQIYSTPVLNSYARLFTALFGKEKNIYNLGKDGINLEIKNFNAEDLNNLDFNPHADFFAEPDRNLINAEEYLKQELKDLLCIKDLLSNGENSRYRKEDLPLTLQLENLIKNKDYLYLHFPDGFTYRNDPDFLKRIRAETDSFIKILKNRREQS